MQRSRGPKFLTRLAAVVLAVVVLAACSSDDGIVVTSYNFPESEIIGEIYAQALEGANIPVERSLNLGTRELLYPELRAGRVDLVAEYVGSGLIGQFDEQVPDSPQAATALLASLLVDDGLVVLDAAPGENNQAFVVASSQAQAQGWTTLSDLVNASALTFAGPPECEERLTCFRGLLEIYGLTNLTFTSIQEASPRLAALDAGDVDMILLFSTDAPLADASYLVLQDDARMLPPENLVPVVSQAALDAHPDAAAVIANVTARLTTEALQQMNAQSAQGQSAEQIARAFLAS